MEQIHKSRGAPKGNQNAAKPERRITVSIRLPPTYAEYLKQHGGSKWVEQLIEESMEQARYLEIVGRVLDSI